MNVGFRPRLKARPSLYDLVHNRSIEQLSLHPRHSFEEELPSELPPLPSSPLSSPPSTPVTVRPIQVEVEPAEMPPKKPVVQDEDEEEQYGTLKQIAA